MMNDTPKLEIPMTKCTTAIALIDEIPLFKLRAEYLIVTDKFWMAVRGWENGNAASHYFSTVFDPMATTHFMVPKFGGSHPDIDPQKLKLMDGTFFDTSDGGAFGDGYFKFDEFLNSRRLVVQVGDGVLPEYVQMILDQEIAGISWGEVNVGDTQHGLAVDPRTDAFQNIVNLLERCLPQQKISVDQQKHELEKWLEAKNKKSAKEQMRLHGLSATCQPQPRVDRFERRYNARRSWNALFEALREPTVSLECLTPEWVNKNLFSDNVPFAGSFWADVPRKFIKLWHSLIPLTYEEDDKRREYFRRILEEKEDGCIYGEKRTEKEIEQSVERCCRNMYWDALEKYDELNTGLDEHCRSYQEGGTFGISLEGVSHIEAYFVARIKRAIPRKTMVFDRARRDIEIAAKAKGAAEQKQRTMRMLSHEIKGLISSQVIDPLVPLEKHELIADVLRGARLLRQIVNSINIGSDPKKVKDSFYKDLRDAGPESDPEIVTEILFDGLKAAAANMFDAGYFNRFFKIHFCDGLEVNDALLDEARSAFSKIEKGNFSALQEFCQTYLNIEVRINVDPIENIAIGHAHDSSMRLLLFVQELFQNAVKQASLVSKGQRWISFEAVNDEGTVAFNVSNSCLTNDGVPTGSVGSVIIEEFIKAFDVGWEWGKQVELSDGVFNCPFKIDFKVDEKEG
jgi:hypothetical protein